MQQITALSLAGTDLGAVVKAGVPLRPDQSPARVYLKGLGRGSRRTMAGCLESMAGMLSTGRLDAFSLPWHTLRYQHTQALRAALLDGYAPATVNKHLAALRGVLHEAFRLGLMGAEDYARATDIRGVKGSTLPRGRALSPGEIRALCDAVRADKTPAGARDAALLAVLYGAGLRRAEACSLDVEDYDAESGALTIRGGKGGKDRISYATNGARTALRSWLETRGTAPGALFVAVDKAGQLGETLSPAGVWYILRSRGVQAGVKAFSPHDLRRSYISDLLDSGQVDLVTVQKLAGHANPSTTARYDRRGEEVKRRAASFIHLPL